MTLEELQRLIAAGDQVELEVHGLDTVGAATELLETLLLSRD